jgi:hypothetical protein
MGRLKMISDRMSPSSSGGVLDSSSSGRCASPCTRTRASTPDTSRVAVTFNCGLVGSGPLKLTVPSRRSSKRRPWNS